MCAGAFNALLLNGPSTNAPGRGWAWGLSVRAMWGCALALCGALSVPLLWQREPSEVRGAAAARSIQDPRSTAGPRPKDNGRAGLDREMPCPTTEDALSHPLSMTANAMLLVGGSRNILAQRAKRKEKAGSN